LSELRGIPCVFCELASEKRAVADNEPISFSIADKPAGFFIFL